MERTYTVSELLGAVKRRWKGMAVVAGAVFAMAVLVIARLPNEYRARALVMVETLHPHPDLVIPVFSRTLEERVKSVRAQLYARQLMATAIEELKLYPQERDKDGMDAAVEALRNDTEVHPEGDDSFSVTVRSRDPALAAKTANRLAELFIEGNLQVRAGQVARTRDVISQQLAQLRGELSKAETRTAAFKRANLNTLPDLQEARMRERDQLVRQVEVETAFIQTAQQRIDLIGVAPPGRDTEVGRIEQQVDDLRNKLGSARAALTPEHPDVQAYSRELGNAQARLEQARARAAANDLEQRRMTEAISRGRKTSAQFQTRVAEIDKLIAASPVTATQLAELDRDTDMLKVKVGQLISKKAEAEIAADLEAKNAPAEFRVLESASAPALPASPNRPQMALLALLAALALGCAVAVGQEVSDQTLRSEQEAVALSLPVLATVPRLYGMGTSRVLALPAMQGEQG
jgi:succinoglycan biosynthesis transport protein ExoP